MIVALRFERPMRPWHRRLTADLEAAGFKPRLEPIGVGRWTPLDIVLAAERCLYRTPSPLPRWDATSDPRPADVAIALDGGDALSKTVLEPVFDGEPGEGALARAILRGRAPMIAIRRRSNGEILATGLPAIEDPGSFSRSMHQVFVRLGVLFVQALQRIEPDVSSGRHTGPHAGHPCRPDASTLTSSPQPFGVDGPDEPCHDVDASKRIGASTRFLVRGLAGRLAHRLGPARGRPDHWRIGYRLTNGAGVVGTRTWPGEAFMLLPDDGERFYADPFPFEHDGRHFLFFEDFPYTTRKGVIGLVEIDAAGVASPPRTVLEQPVHLSYPLVMRHEGAIVMLPEMTQARRVQLFRADPFPDRWVPADILIDDVVAADATPVWHDGRFWLFVTLAGDGGSSWDQLGLFHAPALTGPWTPHAANPVLIDAGAARPAGFMWHDGGVLMRVVQDCRAGYGSGLAICRVDRLDEDGFAQTVVARLPPPASAGARGVHTLNRGGALEVVDLKVSHPPRRRA